MLIICVAITLLIAGELPVSWALSMECSKVRTPCWVKLITDQQQHVDACTAGSRYVICLAQALDLAEKDGRCGSLALDTYRHDSFKLAMSYAANCPSFVIPSSLRLDSCHQQLANCGESSLGAFVANGSNNNTKKCSELDALKTCIETQTSSCYSGQLSGLVQSEMTRYQYQETCVPSFSTACSKVRTPCMVRKITEQQQHYPPCIVGQHYFNCLARSFDLAARTGTCEELAVSTYRHDTFLSATNYHSNCPDFVVPSSLALSGCPLEAAICGSDALSVFVANNEKNDAAKCSKLESFKTCMESNTPSCTDRQIINRMVNKDLIYYEYQTTCVDTTTTTTTTTTTPPPTTTTTTTTPTTTQKSSGNNGGTTGSSTGGNNGGPDNGGIANGHSIFSLVAATALALWACRLRL